MTTVLKFTDGTTEIDFINDDAYHLVRWDPAVARRRGSLLGGRGPYEDVAEEMEITISGATALAKLATLQALFDQAQRWARGEPVTAVALHYQPEGSSTTWKATVLGPSRENDPLVQLPPNFPLSPTIQMIDPVILRFRRLGAWLGGARTSTSATAAQGVTYVMGSVATGTLADVDIESPVVLKLYDLPETGYSVSETYVLMASGADTTAASSRLFYQAAETLTATNWTTASDAANLALNGVVLRFTPPIASLWYESGSVLVSGTAAQDARRWGVYVTVRDNSTSGTEWQLKAELDNNETRPVVVPSGAAVYPATLYLGAVTLPTSLSYVGLQAKASDTAGTLDIDTLVLQAQDSETTDRTVAINRAVSAAYTTGIMQVDHRLLTNLGPAVWFDATPDQYMNYRGDAVFMMRGASVAAVFLGTGEGRSLTKWKVTNSAGTGATVGFLVTQTEATLTPK